MNAEIIQSQRAAEHWLGKLGDKQFVSKFYFNLMKPHTHYDFDFVSD